MSVHFPPKYGHDISILALLSLLALLLINTSGCQSDLTPTSTVVRLRILGIQAEPPEVAPGDTFSIRALAADPNGYGRTLEWFGILCTPDMVNGGCLEYNAIEAAYPTSEVVQYEFAQCCARGGEISPRTIGFELGGPNSNLTTLGSSLEGLTEEAAQEGVNAQVTLLLCQSGVCSSAADPDSVSDSSDLSMTLPEELSAVAIKRVRVSTKPAEERNQNPAMDGVLIGETTHTPTTDLLASPGKTYTLRPLLHFDAIEEFALIAEDGTQTMEQESPFFSWFSTAGAFEEAWSDLSTNNGAVAWTAPESPEKSEDTVFLVVRDRRGGFAWTWFIVRYS